MNEGSFELYRKGKFSYPHPQLISQIHNSLQNILQSVDDDGFSPLQRFNTKEINNGHNTNNR